jgi:D-arabinose 1-dehydrogenase-like Zn-dependent alcohol dehydrogenase
VVFATRITTYSMETWGLRENSPSSTSSLNMANSIRSQIKSLGHEYVGDIVAVSDGEKKWKVGDRVGGAWHGGHDGTCKSCARGQFQMCENESVNGVSREGGYGQYATLRTEAAVSILNT